MPIHDQSYRRYRGERESAASAWTVIATTGIVALLKKRLFLGLLLLAWLPFAIRAGQIYFAVTFPQISFIAMKAETFRQFFDQQSTFVFFVTLYVGSGLIANDRRANALQIYLSKPLTRAEYIGGKMAILLSFLLLVTIVPGLLLLLLQILFAGSVAFLRENLFLVPAITLYSLVETLVAAFSMLALSSMSNSSRFVAVLYTGLVLFTRALAASLGGILGTTALSWLSFSANLQQVGDLVFRQPLRYDTPPAVSALVLLGLVALSVSVLERKVRGVEVVT